VVWNLSLQEIAAHPLIGIGYGNKTFELRFGDDPETVPASHSHNTFLMVTMGSGVPAGILLVWVFVNAFLALAQNWRKTADRTQYALMISLAIMLVGFFVHNLFDNMFFGSLANVFWILLALGLVEGIYIDRAAQGKACES